MEELSPQYVGHSFGDLYLALTDRKRVTVKGEFESTIDYKARVAKINGRPLVGTVNLNSLLAFSFLPDGEQFVLKYDADLTVLNVSLKWRRQYEFGSYDNKFHALMWSVQSRKVGSYVGRNVFNRSVRVSVYRNDHYYLGTEHRNLEGLPSFKEGPLDYSLETSIFMPPHDARLAKSNLRALVIGRLAEQPVLYSENRDTPEVTDPYDRYNFTHAISIVVEEVWFYDFPSGNILLKVSNL